MENGSEVGHRIIIETVDKLIGLHNTDPKQIKRIAICGNPAQLSMFENIEIRDLAYAGQSILQRLNVKVPERRAHTRVASDLGIGSVHPEAEVRCPPSIRHEIGADALAMIIKSHMLERKETCMVTDYGTNAEMGLYKDGELWTGSAAAGPAMEGQSIEFGMLAAPMAHWTRYSLHTGDILSNSGTASRGLKANVAAYLAGSAIALEAATTGSIAIAAIIAIPIFAAVAMNRGLLRTFQSTNLPYFGYFATLYYLFVYPAPGAAGAITGLLQFAMSPRSAWMERTRS